MKIFGWIKDNEHIVTCKCGAIIKFSNKDIVSEDKYDVDYWGVDRWKEKSITYKSCNRKIYLR